MKLKALLVVRRIILWEILCMDKCLYVVHSFYTRVDACTRVYTSGLMPCMFFAFAHATHTRVTCVCRLSSGWFVPYLYNHCANFYQIHIFYALHIRTWPYIPHLKEIGPVVYEIFVHENCPILFTFFFFFAPFYESNFVPTKETLLIYQFLSNLTHL